MNQIIKAPNTEIILNRTSIFLAGGISNCPDWQEEIMYDLKYKCNNLTIINPRRNNFDGTDIKNSEYQIKWEDQYLKLSKLVLFWFPEETLCPITLFELGKCLATRRYIELPQILIGIHPNYKRKIDVEIQSRLYIPSIKLHNNLKDLTNYSIKIVKQINEYIDND